MRGRRGWPRTSTSPHMQGLMFSVIGDVVVDDVVNPLREFKTEAKP